MREIGLAMAMILALACGFRWMKRLDAFLDSIQIMDAPSIYPFAGKDR